MKKTILSAVLTATSGAIALASPLAHAADGTLAFNGEVMGTTCTVTGSGGAAGTGNITVTLPTISASALAADGQAAGNQGFSLVLGGGDNCTNGKTGAMWVETAATPALDTATGALKNQAAGGASNVQVRLVNPTNAQPINLAINNVVGNGDTVIGGSNQPAATITGNTAELKYVAQYLAVGGAASAGAVTTFLTYSMQYN